MHVRFQGNYELVLHPRQGRPAPGDDLHVLGAAFQQVPLKAPLVQYRLPSRNGNRIGIVQDDERGDHFSQYMRAMQDFYRKNPHLNENREYVPLGNDFGDVVPVEKPEETAFFEAMHRRLLDDPPGADRIHVYYRRSELGLPEVERVDVASVAHQGFNLFRAARDFGRKVLKAVFGH